MPAGQANPWVRSVFADGTLLVSTSLPDSAASTERTIRYRVVLNRLWPTEERTDSLLDFLGPAQIRHPQYRDATFGNALFTPVPSYSASGTRIALTSGEHFEIGQYDLSGKLVEILRRRLPPIPVAAGDREEAADRWAARIDSTVRDRFRAEILAASPARSSPPIGGIRFATDGRLWARYGERGPDDSPPMAVFDSTGRWETDVAIPRGITVNEIGADYLLGSLADDDGFYHLRLYRIRRLPRS